MTLKWYIAVLAADDDMVPPSEKLWHGAPTDQRYCEYPDCPHYVFAELTLERFRDFIDEEPLTMSFDFWEVDPASSTVNPIAEGSNPEIETDNVLTEENVLFFESVKIDSIYGGPREYCDSLEQTKIAQECARVDRPETENDTCPWTASDGDCWKNEPRKVKYTMKRRLVDHVETSQDATYYIRGGFGY